MHSQLAQRLRRNSLSPVPPLRSSPDYSTTLANLSAHILYRSPLPSQSNLPIFVLNATAFPDAKEVDYDALLPYVLSRLPGEEELIGGKGYEVLFLAGGGDDGTTTTKKGRPGWGWFVQAYHVVSYRLENRLVT
jgi:Rho GTPase-activating protein 1